MQVNGYDWQNKTVLVTGASGFKGSWLTAALLRLGAKVYGTIRPQLNPNSAFNLLSLNNQLANVNADISVRQQVTDMINSVAPDVIFHLAAKALVPVAIRDPLRAYEVNVMGTLNILEACRRLGICQRMIICSTDHVFGNINEKEMPKDGFPELSRVSYGGPYDTSKAAMELSIRSYYKTYWKELPEVGITRCANVFGCGDVGQRRVIPLFIESAMNTKSIELKYRLNGRQFIHISDAIIGYIKAASSLSDITPVIKRTLELPDRSPFTPTFHFAIEKYGNPNEPFIRMENLAKMVASICGGTQIDDSKCIDYALHENRIQALSCASTRKILQWQPNLSLDTAIEHVYNRYQMRLNTSSMMTKLKEDVDEMLSRLQS